MTLAVATMLGVIGFGAGMIDARLGRAWLIALLVGLWFYPLIELLYLERFVPWTPLITRYQATLAALDFRMIITAFLAAYVVGRLIGWLSAGRTAT
jgi:hypothetical protein